MIIFTFTRFVCVGFVGLLDIIVLSVMYN